MNKPLLVFDMDGVLVDVTESYRETIARTVEHFTGTRPTHERIQQYKNLGGFNDDWILSHRMVSDLGGEVPYEVVKEKFQSLFLGNGADGLMLREQWVARPGTLEKLKADFNFAIFTGRPKPEAQMTLDRFAPDLKFQPIIGMYDIEKRKPAPDGLLAILKEHCDCKVYYVGDTVDDAQAARAARVPFIGIAAPSNSSYLDLVFLFQEHGAYAIVDDINYLEEVFTA